MSKFERIYIPLAILAVISSLYLEFATGDAINRFWDMGFDVLGSASNGLLLTAATSFLITIPGPYFLLKTIHLYKQRGFSNATTGRLLLYVFTSVFFAVLLAPITIGLTLFAAFSQG